MTTALRTLAADAARMAYAPHSGFHVGAALTSRLGNTYIGCNVENASFPVGVCAERAAIAAAVVAEGAAFQLMSIVVIALDRHGVKQRVAPCGACRQALVEFGADAEVSFGDADGTWHTVIAGELLPHRFIFEQPLTV